MNIITLDGYQFIMTEQEIFSYQYPENMQERIKKNHEIIQKLVMDKFNKYIEIYNKEKDIADVNYTPTGDMSANIVIVRRKGNSTLFSVRCINFANFCDVATKNLISAIKN